jgi:hypothetical protein
VPPVPPVPIVGQGSGMALLGVIKSPKLVLCGLGRDVRRLERSSGGCCRSICQAINGKTASNGKNSQGLVPSQRPVATGRWLSQVSKGFNPGGFDFDRFNSDWFKSTGVNSGRSPSIGRRPSVSGAGCG